MRKWIGVLWALVAGGLAVGLGTLVSLTTADFRTQELQPIAFSHALHAGALEVNCLFCHRHAERSSVADIPAVAVCMMCHDSLEKQSAEAQKVLVYWNKKEPIPWRTLQRLPDFVYFTHEMHLSAGLNCVECHGAVNRMTETPRAPTFEMGWCLACHKRMGASQDCFTCHY